MNVIVVAKYLDVIINCNTETGDDGTKVLKLHSEVDAAEIFVEGRRTGWVQVAL